VRSKLVAAGTFMLRSWKSRPFCFCVFLLRGGFHARFFSSASTVGIPWGRVRNASGLLEGSGESPMFPCFPGHFLVCEHFGRYYCRAVLRTV